MILSHVEPLIFEERMVIGTIACTLFW